MKLSKAQRAALFNLWRRGASHKTSYKQFRRSVSPYIGGDCVLVPFCGMWVGIEADGYTHS